MALAIVSEPPPLRADDDGVMRVGNTRVTLDSLVGAYNAGLSPEEIVLEFDSLRLEEVYLVLGYYLRHEAEIDSYLKARLRRGEERQADAEARLPWAEVRARLMARQQRPADAAPRNR
jgi:uncharacterized protein (DUF433 family)